MTTPTIGAEIIQTESPSKGVETGSFQSELIENQTRIFIGLIDDFASHDHLKIHFLRALAKQTLKNIEQARVGFTSDEIVDQMSEQLGRRWPPGGDDVPEKVRKLWKDVEKLWESKQEGVMQSFSDKGFEHYLAPWRVEGCGSGHRTLFSLALQPLAVTSVQPLGAALSQNEIRYIAQDVQEASWPMQLLFKALNKHKLARLVFILPPLLLLISLLIFGVFAMLQLMHTNADMALWIKTFTSIFVGFFSIWLCSAGMLLLAEWRIVSAPMWMQSIDDDRLLELRGQPRYKKASIKVIRYAAPCALCGGNIKVKSRSFWRPWDLIGRCDEAPAAHVYTFDHVNRTGRRISSMTISF